MRFLIIFFLMCSVCWAQEINKKYSYQAYPYHDLSFKDRPVEEFNNTTIVGTCFYQEWVEGDTEIFKDIFPDGMNGVVFRDCGLDNVYIPPGNKIEGRSVNRGIKVQNDFYPWYVDKNGKPIEPVNKELWSEKGIDTDPKKIPKEKLTKEERYDFEKNFYNLTVITP